MYTYMLVYVISFLNFIFVDTIKHQKPVAEKIWSVRCSTNDYVLNDCNWCACGPNHRFQCKARVCEEVDVYGHFKDTIQELDVGMEGHGTWRSRPTSCTPGVHYSRGTVVCICDENGSWPNPVCRDLFRILYSVEVTEKIEEPKAQNCLPSKLYLVGCNACFCSPSGKLEAHLCTNRTCTDGDPVLEPKEIDVEPKTDNKELKAAKIIDIDPKKSNASVESGDSDAEDTDSDGKIKVYNDAIAIGKVNKALEIYGPCSMNKIYRVGQNYCECLASNRLVCEENNENIARAINEMSQPFEADPTLTSKYGKRCKGKVGVIIRQDCNLCSCRADKQIYCSVKKCTGKPINKKIGFKKAPNFETVPAPSDNMDCVVNTKFKLGCKTCYCIVKKGKKIINCYIEPCNNDQYDLKDDCVVGTAYEKNCLSCICNLLNGKKQEVCHLSSRCQNSGKLRGKKIMQMDDLNGHCDPGQTYKKDCNMCTCSENGQAVFCTKMWCKGPLKHLVRSSDRVEAEIVPFQQESEPCPEGHSYKIDCNLCICLSNGNALCTTSDCSKQLDKIK